MPAPVTRGVDTPVHLLKRVQVCSLLTSEGSLARHAAATLHRSACRQSRSCIHGLRAAAQERQVNWVVREYGNSASIPTSVLLSFLRQELQARCSSAARACATPRRRAAGSEPASWHLPLPPRRLLCVTAALHSVVPGTACRAWTWRRRSALRRRPRQPLATQSTRWRTATSSTRSRGGQARTAWPDMCRGPTCRARALAVRTSPQAAAAEGGWPRAPGGAPGRLGDHVHCAAERVPCSAPGGCDQQGPAAGPSAGATAPGTCCRGVCTCWGRDRGSIGVQSVRRRTVGCLFRRRCSFAARSARVRGR